MAANIGKRKGGDRTGNLSPEADDLAKSYATDSLHFPHPVCDEK